MGSQGLFNSGFIFEEFLPELNGWSGVRQYREMLDNDPVIGGIMYAITMVLRDVEWRWEPPEDLEDDDEQAKEAVDFIKGVFGDMSQPWSRFIMEVLTFLGYGHCVHEIVWKRRGGQETSNPRQFSKFDDGMIGIRKLCFRPQETIYKWNLDGDGGLKGVYQMPLNGDPEVYLPIEKILLVNTFGAKSNPEGRSIIRNSYIPYKRKNSIEVAEGRAALRAAGLAVLTMPSAYTKPDADVNYKAVATAYAAIMQSIAQDKQGALILPSDTDAQGKALFEFKYVGVADRKPIDLTPVIERYDKRIAASVLADFILLGQQAVGSFALSSDKTALFGRSLGAYLTMIADVVNLHLIPRLWKMNNLDPKLMPRAVPGEPEERDLQELGDFLMKAAGAGMPLFPDLKLENRVRDIAKLPSAEETAPAQAVGDAKARTAVAGADSAEQMAEQGPPAPGGPAAKPTVKKRRVRKQK